MPSLQTLPPSYQSAGTIDITADRRLLYGLNLLAVLGMAAFGWLFLVALVRLRPQDAANALVFSIGGLRDFAVVSASVLALVALHVIVHEAIHGIFFWLFTGTRPRFALRWTHAYAAAPDWYIPRNAYLVTSLAPLVLMTLGGLALMAVAPVSWLLPLWFVITMNAAGSVGDLLVAAWLLRLPQSALAQDRGDAVTLFTPRL